MPSSYRQEKKIPEKFKKMSNTTTENMSWKENWVFDSNKQETRQGGQGIVKQVHHKVSNLLGALKELPTDNMKEKKRRYRMMQEVSALQVLEGKGTPKIYESNVQCWENINVPLYAIMEWIEGKTLAQYVNGRAIPLDEALQMTFSLLKTIETCHSLDIYHRDFKPDNIILRGETVMDPVLVDFGMARHHLNKEKDCGFETSSGEELGNRFLRLPEYSANRHDWGLRSDLTVLAGLLFYCVTGEAPRTLRNAQDKMPHESEPIPESLRQDRRWTKLNRFFSIAFQQSLERRFQSSERLKHFLESLEPSVEDNDFLVKRQESLEATLKETRMREREQIANTIRVASEHLVQKINERATSFNFILTGSYTIEDNGFRRLSIFGISLHNVPQPRVQFIHSLRCEADDYVASYQITEKQIQREYYRGPLADPASLSEASTLVTKEIFSHLLTVYQEILERPHSNLT